MSIKPSAKIVPKIVTEMLCANRERKIDSKVDSKEAKVNVSWI